MRAKRKLAQGQYLCIYLIIGERNQHHLYEKSGLPTYPLQRTSATGRLWLLDAIAVGLFVLVVISMAGVQN